MDGIRRVLIAFILNIILVSGTVYLTDQWGYLQPVMLVGGATGILLVFGLTGIKLRIHINNFFLYSFFIFCCLLSALVNVDTDLFLGALILYFIYISLSIVCPSIYNTEDLGNNYNKIIVDSYLYSHLILVILPILVTGINKIPYRGIFYNPNSYGTITATIYAVTLSKLSYTVDCFTLDGKLSTAQILVNSILLLIIFTLTIISKSRTGFFSVLFITIFYIMNTFINLVISGKIKLSAVIRFILVFIVGASLSSFIAFKTRIFKLIGDTVINKMVEKSNDLLSGRAYIWYRAIIESRLLGNGRDYFTAMGNAAYNTYISVLGQYGIIPVLLYCSFLLNLLYHSYIYLKRNKEDEYRYFPIYSILMYMLLSIGEGMFFKDSMLLTFFAIGSILNDPPVIPDAVRRLRRRRIPTE